jgi:hypothetical protein
MEAIMATGEVLEVICGKEGINYLPDGYLIFNNYIFRTSN